jgi:hypothetical protein
MKNKFKFSLNYEQPAIVKLIGVACVGVALTACFSPPSSPVSVDVDTDSDGILDNVPDNCIQVANGENEDNQLDTDGDGRGDACDGLSFPDAGSELVNDGDNDGADDAIDNCQGLANADQLNFDGDAEGDACDADDDNDGAGDGVDNCELLSNNQDNFDGDGFGDACDSDADGDNVEDSIDNCLLLNASQDNFDGDAFGDACDDDDDNDSILDVNENPGCQFDDATNCGVIDGDADEDGVLNSLDNCSSIPNLDQADNYGLQDGSDGSGDACEDTDNDTVLDLVDNCPESVNTNQLDFDGDLQGDVCDTDDDNDGFVDVSDSCQFVANSTDNGDGGLTGPGSQQDVSGCTCDYVEVDYGANDNIYIVAGAQAGNGTYQMPDVASDVFTVRYQTANGSDPIPFGAVEIVYATGTFSWDIPTNGVTVVNNFTHSLPDSRAAPGTTPDTMTAGSAVGTMNADATVAAFPSVDNYRIQGEITCNGGFVCSFVPTGPRDTTETRSLTSITLSGTDFLTNEIAIPDPDADPRNSWGGSEKGSTVAIDDADGICW